MGVKILTRWELLRRKRSVVFNQLTVGKRGVEPFLPPGLLFSDHREGSYPPPLAGVWFGGGARMLWSCTASQSPPSSSAPVFLESLLPRGSSHCAVCHLLRWTTAFVSRSLSSWSASGRLAVFVNLKSALHSSYPSLLPEARWPQDLIWRGKWETHFTLKIKPSSRLQGCIVQHRKYSEYFVITVNRA